MFAPAALVGVPLLLGSAAAILGFDRIRPDFAVVSAGAALVACAAAAAAVLQDQAVEACVALAAASLCVGLSSGAEAAHRAYSPPLLQWFDATRPEEPVAIDGILRHDASLTASGASFTIGVTRIGGGQPPEAGRSLGGMRIHVAGALLDGRLDAWRAGRRIRAPVLVRRPATYINPGAQDGRRALARGGVVLIGTVKSGALVDVLQRGTRVEEAAAAARSWTRRRLGRYLAPLGARSAAVAAAVLIGDRSRLSAEDERRLQDAGTYHVIAISGGNIAVLALLGTAASRLLVPPRAAAVLTAAGLVFYALVAGGAPSVARAVTVAVVVLAGRALDHRGSPLNALVVAAVLAAAIDPPVVLDPGFLLSFGATLGILLGLAATTTVLGVRPARSGSPLERVRRAAAILAAATLCAEAALLPLNASLFGRVPVGGLLLNLVAVPMMAVVQVAGIAVVVAAGWWDGAARLSAWCAHRAAGALFSSASLVEVAPWLVLDVRPPVWWLIVAYYTCLSAWCRGSRTGFAAAGALGAAAVMVASPDAAARDAVRPAAVPLRVAVLDVGQGDASAVILPGRRTLLVDAGGVGAVSSSPARTDPSGGFDVGERVVVPALRALGVRRLDGIVLTHGDPDHILGVRGVLRRLEAQTIWEGVPVPPHAGLQALAAFARGRSMSWRTVQAGDSERFGGVEVRVLHPPLPEWERQRVRNDDSVVLELRLGRVSIILPGDIEREGERAIVHRLDRNRLVVLKAPHHGSTTSSSSELLDAIRPAVVIFSSGRDNRFGHPHPAVVARYRAAGATVFSTAADGAVLVETDGTALDVAGWTGRRARVDAAHGR